MARSDQWIGLSGPACKFIENATDVPDEYGKVGAAFGDFDFETGAWSVDGVLYKEILQASPWSSGPMYFTCLVDPDGKRHFEWVVDYNLRGQEYDAATGRYYV